MEATGLSALDPILVKEEPIEPSSTILNFPPLLNTSIHSLNPTESSVLPQLLTPSGTTGPKRKRVKTEPKKMPFPTSNGDHLKFKSDDTSGVSEQKVDEDVLKLFNSKICLRQGINTYFSNGDSDSFPCSCVLCQNSASDPTFGALCCSVCSSSLLTIFKNTVRIVHPHRKNKSQVGKQNMIDIEHPAVLEVEAWARKKARDKFGWCYGGYALLIDQDTIVRMAMLAKKGVLKTVQDVEHETDWWYAKELGGDVLAILQRQFSSDEDHDKTQTSSSSKSKKALQPISQGQGGARRCGYCKEVGHYKTTCPVRLVAEGRKETEGKENV